MRIIVLHQLCERQTGCASIEQASSSLQAVAKELPEELPSLYCTVLYRWKLELFDDVSRLLNFYPLGALRGQEIPGSPERAGNVYV